MENGEVVVEGVTVRRRWRQWWWLPSLVAVAFAAWSPFTRTPETALLVLGSVVFSLGFQAARTLHRGRLRLGITSAQVTLDGRREIARSNIRRAFVIHHGRWLALRIESRWGTALDVVLPDAGPAAIEAAAGAVEALGFGSDRRAVEFVNPLSLVRGAAAWVLGAFFGGIAGVMISAALLDAGLDVQWYLCGLPLAWAIARSLRTVDLAVGADGIELRGPWRRRFVPYSRLVEVRWTPGATLEIDEKGAPRLSIAGTSLVDDVTAVDGFLFAVQRAREQYAARRRDAALASVIARGERTVGAWREALRALVDVGHGYRSHGLTRADLEAVLGDPAADEELRVGAALALRALDPAEEVTRIRVAAEACAHAPMRAALERAADDTLDDAALAKLRRGA